MDGLIACSVFSLLLTASCSSVMERSVSAIFPSSISQIPQQTQTLTLGHALEFFRQSTGESPSRTSTITSHEIREGSLDSA
jgi:hypothetical protein